MKDTKIVIHFPKNLVDKAIVYRLVKDFDMEFNILKAEIYPNEEGILVLELKGDDANFKKSLAYLKKTGAAVQSLSKDVAMDRDKCVDCTVCVPICPTKALEIDEDTKEVKFIKDKCIACGICLKACPYAAMTIEF